MCGSAKLDRIKNLRVEVQFGPFDKGYGGDNPRIFQLQPSISNRVCQHTPLMALQRRCSCGYLHTRLCAKRLPQTIPSSGSRPWCRQKEATQADGVGSGASTSARPQRRSFQPAIPGLAGPGWRRAVAVCAETPSAAQERERGPRCRLQAAACRGIVIERNVLAIRGRSETCACERYHRCPRKQGRPGPTRQGGRLSIGGTSHRFPVPASGESRSPLFTPGLWWQCWVCSRSRENDW